MAFVNAKFSQNSGTSIKVGISGTGFIGSGLLGLMDFREDFVASKVLTRRKGGVPKVDDCMRTSSVEELVECSDVLMECSGDISRAAEVVEAAFAAGKPVVTMGAEFNVTVGSYFVGKGLLTEAEGDQPGSLAALREEAIDMGFEPLVYGNIKGFLNHDPLPDEMHYWSERNGISVTQVTSFTDGTKLQIEQALVANGLDADIAVRGLLGPKDEALDVSAAQMGRTAKVKGRAISDYVLNRTLPAGVFVVGEHHSASPNVLRYLKLGEGPFYTLMRPYHLCHLEVFKTLRRVVTTGKELLNNSANPRINVAAVAKKAMRSGAAINTAIGGFEVRGEAVHFSEAPHAVPIGLLSGARIARKLEAGQTLTWDDVELPDNKATRIGLELYEKRLAGMDMLPLANRVRL